MIVTATTKASCAEVIGLYEDHAGRANSKDYSGFPILYWHEVCSDGRAAIIKGIVHDTASLMDGVIFLETLLLCGLGVGGHHPAHADSKRWNGSAWVPNHTPQRTFSALCYLNSDFEGGELDFPDRDIRITPTAGMIVTFPTDERYVHQVLPVAAGKRYSISMWFTADPNRELCL